MFKIKTTRQNFDKLVKRIVSKKSKEKLLRLFSEEIAEKSREYITQGKVRPELSPITLVHRRKRGIVNEKPLFFRRNLRDSIRATDKGITYLEYGDYHRQGFEVPNSAYARYNKFVGLDVPAREFIAYFADSNIKEKINRKVKRRYVKEINQ